MHKRAVAVFFIGLSIIGLISPALAQDPQPSPAPMEFPTFTPSPEGGFTATPSRTPTPPGLAYAQAINEANVRDGPAIEANRLGTIYNGAEYVILGLNDMQNWVQIQFEDSPSGSAWVYRELLELSGNVAGIPILEGPQLPTSNPLLLAMQETLEILTLTPGALGTATAIAALMPSGEATEIAGPSDTPLPTFTPPPLGPTTMPVPGLAGRSTGGEGGFFGVPPAIPILVLGGLGLLGLLVDLLRRIF